VNKHGRDGPLFTQLSIDFWAYKQGGVGLPFPELGLLEQEVVLSSTETIPCDGSRSARSVRPTTTRPSPISSSWEFSLPSQRCESEFGELSIPCSNPSMWSLDRGLTVVAGGGASGARRRRGHCRLARWWINWSGGGKARD
jgi:hypothetical protein